MKRTLLILVFLYVSILNSIVSQIKIEGNIDLDSSWQRIIYVSIIPSFNDVFRCSEQMIIGYGPIDSLGQWSVEVPLQSEPVVVRLHVSKVDYPAASLIIGGKDENYGFLALGSSNLLVMERAKNELFDNYLCKSDDLNERMHKVLQLIERWNKLVDQSSSQEEKTALRKSGATELFAYADTASMLLPAIYAAHYGDAGFNRREVIGVVERIRDRLGSHSYLNAYPRVSESSAIILKLVYLIIGIMILIGGFKFVTYRRRKFKSQLIYSLSQREREVFMLIKNGKTNKEIAGELNVEISTIKSHVNGVFNKLNISSRKDVHLFNS